MKANKLKLLSIAICCFVVSLSEAQCAQKVEKNDDAVRNHQTAICPAGSVMPFAGEVVPGGWLLCDGQQYSNQKYPELYEVIKEKYVPSGSWVIEANKRSEIEKYFCVPDLKGRVIVGVDGGEGRVKSGNTLGASGGEERHKLINSELPISNNPITVGNPFNGVNVTGKYGVVGLSQLGGTENYPNTGGDQPHNNMQPYLVLNYIINTGESKHPKLNINDEKINQLEQEIKNLKISKDNYSTMFNDLVVQVRNGLNPSCAKAWVVFNGSANILDSYGVSSVIKHSSGDFTVKFLKPFNSKNYCYSLSARGIGNSMIAVNYHGFPQTEESIRLITFNWETNGACADPAFVSACFFGNQ